MVFIKKNRKYLAVNENSVASVAAFTFFLNASVSVVSFVFIGYLLFILCIHFGIFVCAQVCCRFIACVFFHWFCVISVCGSKEARSTEDQDSRKSWRFRRISRKKNSLLFYRVSFSRSRWPKPEQRTNEYTRKHIIIIINRTDVCWCTCAAEATAALCMALGL